MFLKCTHESNKKLLEEKEACVLFDKHRINDDYYYLRVFNRRAQCSAVCSRSMKRAGFAQ